MIVTRIRSLHILLLALVVVPLGRTATAAITRPVALCNYVVLAATATSLGDKQCSECGKKLRFGRCTGCLSKTVKKKGQDLRDRAQKTTKKIRQSTKKRVSEIVKKTKGVGQETKRRARELAEQGRENWDRTAAQQQKLVDDARRAARETGEKTRAIVDSRQEIIERVNHARRQAQRHYQEAARIYVPQIRYAIRDPDNQRNMIVALGAAREARRQFNATKRNVTYRSLEFLFDMPVQTSQGTTTLKEFAGSWVVGQVPSLRGSDVVNDPVAVSTALILGDRKYFLTELKIVPSGNERVSVVEGLRRNSSFDATRALELLSIIEATEDLANGERPIGALDDIASSFEKLNGVRR